MSRPKKAPNAPAAPKLSREAQKLADSLKGGSGYNPVSTRRKRGDPVKSLAEPAVEPTQEVKAEPAPKPKPKQKKTVIINIPESPPEPKPESKKAGTASAEWLKVKLAKVKKRSKEHYDENVDQERLRQRAKWEEHKDLYNSNRRKRYADARKALGDEAKPVGRPKAPPPPDIQLPEAGPEELKLLAGKNVESGVPSSTIEVPQRYEILRTMFGNHIKIPPSVDKMPAYHTKHWDELQPETQKGYAKNAVKALQAAGYNIEPTLDPLKITQYMLDNDVNEWVVVFTSVDPARVTESGKTQGQPRSYHTINNDAKGLLGVVNAMVLHYVKSGQLYKDHWTKLVILSTVFQAFNSKAKGISSQKHSEQASSPQQLANIVPWNE